MFVCLSVSSEMYNWILMTFTENIDNGPRNKFLYIGLVRCLLHPRVAFNSNLTVENISSFYYHILP